MGDARRDPSAVAPSRKPYAQWEAAVLKQLKAPGEGPTDEHTTTVSSFFFVEPSCSIEFTGPQTPLKAAWTAGLLALHPHPRPIPSCIPILPMGPSPGPGGSLVILELGPSIGFGFGPLPVKIRLCQMKVVFLMR